MRDHLALELKVIPSPNRTEHGLDYLGCRVYRRHLILNRASRRRFRRKLAWLERQHDSGLLSEADLQKRVTALVRFTRTPGLCSWQFRRAVLHGLAVSGPQARTG